MTKPCLLRVSAESVKWKRYYYILHPLKLWCEYEGRRRWNIAYIHRCRPSPFASSYIFSGEIVLVYLNWMILFIIFDWEALRKYPVCVIFQSEAKIESLQITSRQLYHNYENGCARGDHYLLKAIWWNLLPQSIFIWQELCSTIFMICFVVSMFYLFMMQANFQKSPEFPLYTTLPCRPRAAVWTGGLG